EDNPLQLAGSRNLPFTKSPDERTPLPAGEPLAGIEGHPGDAVRRHPEQRRRLGPFQPRTRGNRRTEILVPVAHLRPAVVASAPQDVDLVAAVRALLGFPQLTGLGVDGERVSVAMADRVD